MKTNRNRAGPTIAILRSRKYLSGSETESTNVKHYYFTRRKS